jgi:hypothetical protein
MQRKWCSCALVLVVTLLGNVRGAIAQSVTWYVDASAPPGGNGSTWPLAFNDLQDALDVAVADDKIWVAAGTYVPSVPAGRAATFDLDVDNVHIFGGFAGTESAISERDIAANETVLSGGTAPSYHVVTVNAITRLNGFTVTGGRADALSHTWGGASRSWPARRESRMRSPS